MHVCHDKCHSGDGNAAKVQLNIMSKDDFGFVTLNHDVRRAIEAEQYSGAGEILIGVRLLKPLSQLNKRLIRMNQRF